MLRRIPSNRMAEFTIELCDALQSHVEANRDEFVDKVGRNCPWSARLADVVAHQ
jgi:hypothetical protein